MLRYCLRSHSGLPLAAAFGVMSVVLEIVAMASVVPLSLIAAGVPIAPGGGWDKAYRLLGVQPTFAATLLFFLGAFAARLLTQFVHQAVAVRIGKRVQGDLSMQAFVKIVNQLGVREIDAKSSGHFIALAGDETARAGATVVALNQLPAAAFLVLLYLGAVFAFSWQLGLAVVSFLLVVLLCLQGLLRRLQVLGGRQLEQMKVTHSVFLDTLNGLRAVRALSAEAFVVAKYDDINRQYMRTHYLMDVLRFAAKLVPAIVLLACVGIAAIAGRFHVANPAELAFVMTALAFVLRFFPTAGEVLGLLMFLLANVRGALDVTHLLEPPPKIGAGTAATLRVEGPVEKLEFRSVSFAYRPERPVLARFSATLRKGRSYAFAGPSGAGKTTLFDLLLGFYAPDEGEVCANGVPVPRIDTQWLRAHIVLVGQQMVMFNDTVANNVQFGADASEQKVRAACKAARIDAFVESLPRGYETLVSFQGGNLSGGQRQRIGIARGLLREADVLLLDESTAGLDAEARDWVVDNILRLYRDRIVVFATHDKDIMARVDEVVMLEPHPR